jgi:hypothetical protein
MRQIKRMRNRGRRLYHRVLYAYNLRLYRDCLDPELQVKLAAKVTYHASKAFDPPSVNPPYPPV